MKRDRQCLFRVVYQPHNNKMIGKINALEVYEAELPNKTYDLQLNSAATLKMLKKFVADVIDRGKCPEAMDDEDLITTRTVVDYLEHTGYRCTEYKDKYEYILIISLR